MSTHSEDYQAYLGRFNAALGEASVGAFIKHQGRLIQKLDPEGFEPVYREYMELATHYLEGMDRGDTINDIVVKMIRDKAAHLILTSPV